MCHVCGLKNVMGTFIGMTVGACHVSYEEEDACHVSYEEEDACHVSYMRPKAEPDRS